MARANYTTAIAIDTNNSVFHFYSMLGNDKKSITHTVKSFAAKKMDESFFEKFKEALKEFTANTPSEAVRKVSIILPDSAVLTDTIKMPTVKGTAQMQKMLDVTLGGLYHNYKDLQILAHMADQNKQYSTIAITAVQKQIVSSIFAACAENKLLVDTLSFACASAVGGALALYPKLKNTSYLFLDVKDIYSRFAFVVDGKVMGYYTLPFGLEFLRKPKITQEDVLFEHSYAELTVLNARERAKAKKLTVLGLADDAASTQNAEQNLEMGELDTELALASESTPAPGVKLFARKSPRNLPKFMQREIPETEEGIAFENFRVFMKWALTLIHGNESITELGAPQFVCVNLPSDLAFVIDKANEEAEENGISFLRLPTGDESLPIASNLELYGGLVPQYINATNKF